MEIPGVIVIVLEIEEFVIDAALYFCAAIRIRNRFCVLGRTLQTALVTVRQCFFRQVFQRRDTVDPQDLIALHEAEGIEHMRSRICRPHRRPKERPCVLKIHKLLQHIVEILPILGRHQELDHVRASLVQDFFQALRTGLFLYILPHPLADGGKAAVRVAAEIAHFIKQLLFPGACLS